RHIDRALVARQRTHCLMIPTLDRVDERRRASRAQTRCEQCRNDDRVTNDSIHSILNDEGTEIGGLRSQVRLKPDTTFHRSSAPVLTPNLSISTPYLCATVSMTFASCVPFGEAM